MRYQGRLSDWQDDKGYGFVTPNGGGERAFVHIKAFERSGRRPREGELISYVAERDARGRCNATRIRYAATSTSLARAPIGTGTRKLPRLGIELVALAIVFTGTVPGWWPMWLAWTYLGMSVLALLVYGADKSAAQRSQRRTPENTLHLLGMLCGWPGALVAQALFRHKSSKAAFQSVFWVTVVLNLVGVAWMLRSVSAI
ncbi:DUF1294 domain-containing protein [Stenotrophomonas sp. Marseille-Q4652]|uniref:DUF1294 domain-containing protein n=1 Tax=Stenotrophomonas sp. Marseille-Q4652 TaxID=2866595 RepID=UPI001CE3BB66|nr:DUF1294 domain-containing protein [Stenotrophomonas sp. Marseille-Q4652]